MTTLRFASWVQPATGAALGEVDPADAAPDDPPVPAPRLLLTPVVHVADDVGQSTRAASGPGLEVLGPSGVVGLEPGEVIGRFPVPGAVGSEAVNLAAVELRATDMPWRFSPARAGTRERLRPWVVLVVVPAEVEVVAGVPAARLTVDVGELPDLAESWAWAHAQLDGDGSDPRRGRSRLLCPRKLPAGRRLRAAVVPAFLGGVAAGLRLPLDPARVHEPAWRVDEAGSVTLPVYDHWEFTTGPDADFEALARRIQAARPRDLGGFGYRTVDVSQPWTGEEPLTGDPALVVLGGALRPLAPAPPDTITPEQADELRDRIAEAIAASADGDLGPPLRGGAHANRSTVATAGGDWLDQANREPVRRLAAGRGSDWVIANQEDLMAKAWLQAGEIREAARRLALGRASVAITESLQRRHLDHLDGDELVAVTAPAAARARLGGSAQQPTLRAILEASAAPAGAGSTTLARLKRPAGVVGRTTGPAQLVSRALAGELADRAGPLRASALAGAAAATPAVAATTVAGQLVARQDEANISAVATAASSLWVAARVASHEGAATPTQLMAAIGDPGGLAAGPAAVAPQLASVAARSAVLTAIGHDRLGAASIPLGVGAGAREAVAIHADGLRLAPDVVTTVVRSSVDAASLVRRRLAAMVTAADGTPAPGITPDDVLPTPDVPVPMSMALIERDPEWFLPGLGSFPLDRATLLSPDDAFAEAVMLGANVELLAEFLWREFPTDRRGTPIRRFWPRPGGDVDIEPIHRWAGELGSHMLIDGDATSVLLVRAELFRRYPTTIVLAAPSEVNPADPSRLRPVGTMAQWLTPLFTVPIDPSTRAVGFAVPPAALTMPLSAENLGWFFVLVEPPTSTRFGFDLGPEDGAVPPPPASWNDTTWAHVIDGRGFASARRSIPPPDAEPLPAPRWGGTDACAADVARIALQRPVRVALHSSRMVG